ncbi:MAG: cytochrome c family protein [Desulfuromonadaceae bacterium]|nr:cytochrome c family protein [Desulfuromonadaceae bacterium]
MVKRILNKIVHVGLLIFLLALLPAMGVAMDSSDCTNCHGDKDVVGEDLVINSLTFDHTAHAEVGCHGCHVSITEQHPDDGFPPSKASCAECHGDVSKSYSNSNHAQNAVCSDCHNPHQVYGPTAVSGQDMNLQCTSCHERVEIQEKHAEWLPQADLHINNLPCVTCHSTSNEYVISLYIIKRRSGSMFSRFDLATYAELNALSGGKPIVQLVDTNADGYISIAELRLFNLDPENKPLRLQGMMTPERLSHNFLTQDNRWDCSFCHSSGPEAMQVSYLSLAERDGGFKRISVEKGAVLDALYGTPDFYMVGATRSKALNYVGLVVLAGGMVVPIGHGTLRFLTRKNRKNEEK